MQSDGTVHPDCYPFGLRWKFRDRLTREAAVDRNNIRQIFVPRGTLSQIIDYGSTLELLEAISSSLQKSPDESERIAKLLCPKFGECSCRRLSCTGGRMLLATLLLIDREDAVFSLYSSSAPQVCDSDLPYRHKAPSLEITESPIAAVLDEADCKWFGHYQWQVFTPLIGVPGQGCVEPGELFDSLPDEISLPWSQFTTAKKQIEGEPTAIYKAEIHKGNHKLKEENTVFAVKVLADALFWAASEKRFVREVQGNRLADQLAPNHSGIVKLLAAFGHCQKFYLLFPWAEGGSLWDLWQNYCPPDVNSTSRPSCSETQSDDPDFMERPSKEATWYSDDWLLRECYRIADAIATSQGFSNGVRRQHESQFHADVKPENILCFECPDGQNSSFMLKLADFGESQRVRAGAKPDWQGTPHAKTQRPPENSLQESWYKYDVWCLGCVYLEFVTWALQGWPGCANFRERRFREEDDDKVVKWPVADDLFFKRARGKRNFLPFLLRDRIKRVNSEEQLAASGFSISVALNATINSQLKRSVTEHLKTLRDEAGRRPGSKLSQFIEFIGEKMLSVDLKKRADAGQVAAYLQSLI